MGTTPDALNVVADSASRWGSKKVYGVIALPGDRSDEVIKLAAQRAGAGFSKLILREDANKRGRRAGEVAEMLFEEISVCHPTTQKKIVLDEKQSLEVALNESKRGEIIVFFYDDLPLALATIRARGGVAVDRISNLDAELSNAAG